MTLALLDLGRMQPGDIPVLAYLIRTDDGTTVLVDSGWPESFVDTPDAFPGLRVEIRPDQTVEAQLARLGVRPVDVDIVVCTHFDDDHAGNHGLFPHATFVVQREHLDAARAGHPRSAFTRPQWDRPAHRFQILDGDVELLPGVELLVSGGHVPGHQSVLVRLPETGPVLLAIDAVPHHAFADPDTRPMLPMDLDEAATRASTRRLMEVAAREGVALVVYGHDAEQAPTLRHAPEMYR